MSFRIRTSIVFSVVAALLTSSVAYAGHRPKFFEAETTGHANPQFVDDCTIVNDAVSTGHALHMGHVTVAEHEVADVCSVPGKIEVVGHFVITAANGDTVEADYTTEGVLNSTTNHAFFAGSWHVTSGTGRFDDASGNGVIVADGLFQPPWDVTTLITGQIRY